MGCHREVSLLTEAETVAGILMLGLHPARTLVDFDTVAGHPLDADCLELDIWI